MQFTVEQVATFLGARYEGDGAATLTSVGRIEDAGPGQLAFLSNPAKYAAYAYASDASALLVPTDFAAEQHLRPALIRVPDVQGAFAQLLRLVEGALPKHEPGVHDLACVADDAELGEGVYVGPFAFVGPGARVGGGTVLEAHSYVGRGAQLGGDCFLQAGARVLRGCVLGSRVRLLANAVIGSDGFGNTRAGDGSWTRIPHIGNVVVEDDVEVGACTTVDRAITGSTVLRRGVRLDNLVMVAHNVVVGEHTAAAAQVGIAGSARIGARVLLGGQVGMAGHITVADDVEVAAQSGIKDSLTEPGQRVFGSPAKGFREWAAEQAALRRIPELRADLKALRREVGELRAALAETAARG